MTIISSGRERDLRAACDCPNDVKRFGLLTSLTCTFVCASNLLLSYQLAYFRRWERTRHDLLLYHLSHLVICGVAARHRMGVLEYNFWDRGGLSCRRDI